MESHRDDKTLDSILTDLSNLLLDIYRAATTTDIATFDRSVFEIIQRYIDFDAAWTGRSTLADDGPIIHNSCTYGLDSEFLGDWEKVKFCDPGVNKVLAQPGKACTICVVDDDIPAEFKDLVHKYALAQTAAIVHYDPTLNLLTHLALYRHGLQHRYTPRDYSLLEHAMPHFASAIDLNRLRQLDSVAAQSISPQVSVAICDRQNRIQYSDSVFSDLMHLEWPDWNDGLLPVDVWHASKSGPVSTYVGSRICIEAEVCEAATVLRLSKLSRLDRLSPREKEVARLFAQGMSYKAVARALDLAPATVRHHLRNIYAKLEVHDKGAIGAILGGNTGGMAA
jgi:DNA-binding CsgD family transcriptional regulator